MADIKLIASDLDGTFMENHWTPHPENVRMLKKCKQHGIPFCLCTGRNWGGVRDLVASVPFDRFCVINNGAAIYDSETDTLRYRNRFDADIALQIINVLLEFDGSYMSVATTHTSHMLEDEMDDAMKVEIQKRMERTPGYADRNFMHRTMDELMQACSDDMQSIHCGIEIAAPGLLETVYDTIKEISDVEISSGGTGFMEITAKDGTKAEALTVLADIYEAQPQNVLAFGDSFNDIYMLLWAGTGVAMGNADLRLKSVADYVTDTNVNAGVAQAIDRIVFNALDQ